MFNQFGHQIHTLNHIVFCGRWEPGLDGARTQIADQYRNAGVSPPAYQWPWNLTLHESVLAKSMRIPHRLNTVADPSTSSRGCRPDASATPYGQCSQPAPDLSQPCGRRHARRRTVLAVLLLDGHGMLRIRLDEILIVYPVYRNTVFSASSISA